jgi:hypothetical protein
MAEAKPKGGNNLASEKHQEASGIVLDKHTTAADYTGDSNCLFPTEGIGQESCDNGSTAYSDRQSCIQDLLVPGAQNPSPIDLVPKSDKELRHR